MDVLSTELKDLKAQRRDYETLKLQVAQQDAEYQRLADERNALEQQPDGAKVETRKDIWLDATLDTQAQIKIVVFCDKLICKSIYCKWDHQKRPSPLLKVGWVNKVINRNKVLLDTAHRYKAC